MYEHLARQNRRITNSLRSGKLSLATNEKTGVQKMQIQLNAFEIYQDVPSLQLYGLASAAPGGSDVALLCLSGDTNKPVAIASNHSLFRPRNMASGETMLYDNAGQSIYLSRANGKLSIVIAAGQEVDITAATAINVTAPSVNIVGNVFVVGSLVASGDVIANGVSLDNHVHGGVQGGSGSTGKAVT